MNKRNNISFLVLSLAVLLFYPGFVKSVHVHHNPHSDSEPSHVASFGQPDKPCLVCDFEFVSFIVDQTERLTVYLPRITVDNITIPEITCLPALIYYSLRAPPTA